MENFRFFQDDIITGATIYAREIRLTPRQLEQITQLRKAYREDLLKLFIEGRRYWLQAHAITKAPLSGRSIDMREAEKLARASGDVLFRANILWFRTANKAAKILTVDQIRWLEEHEKKENSAFPVSLTGNGP